MAPDPFAGLHPNGIERLLVAWHHLEVPGPPPAYQLAGDELTHPDPGIRFARRTIQRFDCAGGRESLALVDKALPHSLFDLMLTEVSARPRSTPMDVEPVTGRTLWRTGLNFVRFCSDPRVIRDFRLAGGELHLALNCDPHTLDRESVQAAKQFHLHLLYWPRPALIPLVGAERLGLVGDRQLRRQALDPVSFLGADLIAEHLAALDLSLPGARVLGPDPAAVLDGTRPLGCLIALPGWAVLAEPAFEDLVRRVHGLLADLSADLLHAFTGRRDIPAPWHRHPLRPGAEILSRLADLPYSPRTRAGLTRLATVLRSLPDPTAARLAQVGPRRRMDQMTLNQPAYALNLHAPHPLAPGRRLIDAPEVHLIIQPRLFSGIGGAGLLTLGGVPSVRVLRGRGTYSPEQWHHRARFQRRFARYNQGRLGADTDLAVLPIRRFLGLERGWA